MSVMPEQKPGRSKQELLASVKDKFWSFVDIKESDKCWEWQRGIMQIGYGDFYVGGGRKNPYREYTHRIALYYSTGYFGEVAMHLCDNRKCCNPAHLKWGSKRDNSQDALSKQRQYIGSSNSFSKLTEEQVIEIRKLYNAGYLQKDLAQLFNTCIGNISAIITKRTWNHV